MSLKIKCAIAFILGFFACIATAFTALPILHRKKPAMMMDVYEDIRKL